MPASSIFKSSLSRRGRNIAYAPKSIFFSPVGVGKGGREEKENSSKEMWNFLKFVSVDSFSRYISSLSGSGFRD